MQDDEFRKGVRDLLAENPGAYRRQINAPTGYVRIANVKGEEWQPGYISSGGGRWSNEGEAASYLAERIETCAAELGLDVKAGNEDFVCELWTIDKQFGTFDVSRMPVEYQEAFFEDKGTAPGKWEKSRILLQEVGQASGFEDLDAIFAPSASGLATGIEGLCFVADPRKLGLVQVATGTYSDFLSGKYTLIDSSEKDVPKA